MNLIGACLSLDGEEHKAKLKSEQIDRSIEEWARQERNVIKVLLSGAAESGKSTLVRQMKIIHHDGFTKEELRAFRSTVLDNLVASLKYVLHGMGVLRINLENQENQVHAKRVLECGRCPGGAIPMHPTVAASVRRLLEDRGVRLAIARGDEYELNDSAVYLFENASRICARGYVPSPTDVLRVRIRTTGVVESRFVFHDVVFRLFDVGGQRSERRKWIHHFDDVKALLYVVALSGYDMTVAEDPTTNRVRESLALFSDICHSRFFLRTSVVLFLNKFDLFRKKILYSGRFLRHYFRDYQGRELDVDAAALYLRDKFLRLNRVPSRPVYPHFTTATDTSSVQGVFRDVMDTIIRENLVRCTLL